MRWYWLVSYLEMARHESDLLEVAPLGSTLQAQYRDAHQDLLEWPNRIREYQWERDEQGRIVRLW